MVNVSVIGATGYVGIEIVRLLSRHPGVRITELVSRSYEGQKISDIYPFLKGVIDVTCTGMDIDRLAGHSDLCITALPHGVSCEVVPQLLDKGLRVIDHSGDYRYRNAAVYEKWYGLKHKSPELLSTAVYGLPEIYRDKIKEASLVSNPGCYPTCSILGLAPLLSKKVIDPSSIIIDAASGITGAGRKADIEYQYCESAENYKPYKVTGHRHTSEIEQELSFIAGEEITVSFTPHLLPMKRGMLATMYTTLKESRTASELIELYREYYDGEYFVRVLDKGKVPETRNTAGSNFIDIALAVDERVNRVVAMSALDNLGKGAAGQAVQVLNLMCGFDERTGIDNPGLPI